MMKYLNFLFCAATAFSFLSAQALAWEPAPGHTQIRIWPGKVPDARKDTGPEIDNIDKKNLVAGKPYSYVGGVSQPTITVYSPEGKNTGAAVVVFPGGGYQILAMDLEGTEVCDWLTSKGITGILLKYRVPGEGKYPKSGAYPKSPLAMEDAQRAVSLVRSRAAEWHIDPHKIGVLGFSAGGHLSAAMSTHADKRIYKATDAVGKISCRPDFAVVLYPGHLAFGDKDDILNPDIRPSNETPPVFLLQAENDPVDTVNNSLVFYNALKNAHVPVEMHLYAEGKHAFGLRRTKFPITGWTDLAETWLKAIGMISQ
jgi:acetyl esterase/lipase